MEITNENYSFYLPSTYINNNYTYAIADDYIIINKGSNCNQQYNTTYCDCFRVYPKFNYISSNIYTCSLNNNIILSSSVFNNNIFNAPQFSDLFLIYFIIIFIFTYILTLLYNVFRKRNK